MRQARRGWVAGLLGTLAACSGSEPSAPLDASLTQDTAAPSADAPTALDVALPAFDTLTFDALTFDATQRIDSATPVFDAPRADISDRADIPDRADTVVRADATPPPDRPAVDAPPVPVDERDPESALRACLGYRGVADFWAAPNRDIEFLAVGDSQYAPTGARACARNDNYAVDQNALMVQALNGIEDARWPMGYDFVRQGSAFRRIRAVLFAGDLTENGSVPLPGMTTPSGHCGEYTAFREDFGLCGDRRLRFPVMEGFGNHDFPFRPLGRPDDGLHPVLEYISRRNPYRPYVVNHTPVSSARAHYSWDWDDIHFVNLNVKPGEEVEVIDRDAGTRHVDPRGALRFLDADLAAHLRGTRQVVIMSHYGPGTSDDSERFSAEDRAEFCAILTRHRAQAIAWIHGHTHKSNAYTWPCNGRSTQVLNVGAPFYANTEGRLHFAVVRIGNQWLEAADVSVLRTAPTRYQIPGAMERSPGSSLPRWGGWTVRAAIAPPR